MLAHLGIKNPRDQLITDVQNFAAQNEIRELTPYLVKGALVAQIPHHIDEIRELDDADRTAPHGEFNNRLKHPRILDITTILNSIAAAVQGWDQTGRRRKTPTISSI